MYNHQPADYSCPFCRLVRGEEDQINRREYVVYEDSATLAFVAPKWWVNNPGHLLIIPKIHSENLYDLPDDLLGAVYTTARKLAIALKATYHCAGISTRQHNEPAGNQDVWHFHVHLFPRYPNDNLYQNHTQQAWVGHNERLAFAHRLQAYFANQP